MISRRRFTQLSGFGLGLSLASCFGKNQLDSRPDPTSNSHDAKADLLIWWEQGYLPEENAGLAQVVSQWEQHSGLQASLKLMEISNLQQELLTAIENPGYSQVPDVVFAVALDTNLAPRLAWQNQLTHVDGILEKHQHLYTPDARSQVVYRNQVVDERHSYALPIGNAGEYLHCWRSLLAKVDLDTANIPKDWSGFWQFWQQAHNRLHQQGNTDVFGIGLCMSALGVDTFTSLRWFLDAHGTKVVAEDGSLILPEAENRASLIAALQEYTGFYQRGFVPPDATDWTASGNNTRFLEGKLVMTHNPTLSIPLTQKLEANPYNKDANNRYRDIETLTWPQDINGNPIYPRKSIKQIIFPKAGKHSEAAMDFAEFLIQPQTLNELLITGFKGRFLPVMPELLSDPYWQNPDDQHLTAAIAMQQQPGPVPYETLNPAYSQILGQQLWGKAVLKILQEQASPKVAADWVTDEIKTTWKNWENIA